MVIKIENTNLRYENNLICYCFIDCNSFGCVIIMREILRFIIAINNSATT